MFGIEGLLLWDVVEFGGIDESKGEWRVRLRSPGLFEEFRQVRIGEGIRLVVGCPKGKWERGRCRVGMKGQSLRFDKEVFKTREDVERWLKEHKEVLDRLRGGQ